MLIACKLHLQTHIALIALAAVDSYCIYGDFLEHQLNALQVDERFISTACCFITLVLCPVLSFDKWFQLHVSPPNISDYDAVVKGF